MQKLIIVVSAFLSSSIAISQTPGINLSHIDSTVSPKNDIYKFANGRWLKTQQIPESDGSWGSFNEINERNLAQIKALLLVLAKNDKALPGTNVQKLRDFYLIAMDSAKSEKDDLAPIKEELTAIDLIKTKDDLIKTSALFNKKGISGIIGFYVYSDFKNSNANTTYLTQTGLGLPDRDFYFDAQYETIRKEYLEHVELMFVCTSNTVIDAKANAKTILKIETELAKFSQNATEQRDIEKQYNPINTIQLKKIEPNINWDIYFSTIGIKTPDTLVLNQPKFYEGLNNIINSITIPEWKIFLKWKLISEAAPYLSSKFVTESFKFNGTVLTGRKQMKPRYKRVQASLDQALGEALGKLYVEEHFDLNSKKKVNVLVDNLVAAYRDRINSRDWMSAETKAQAQLKLDKLIKKLGFPDTWIDYTKLTIGKTSFWENVVNGRKFQYDRMLAKIGKPVDRMEWGMTPPTVNAYYNPTSNEIAFPAGIMQVPFFDPNADDAFNYGVMGAIIGHELTHGFDDQGAQFDADGNLKMWWTESDYKNFKDKTKLIIEQFNHYIAIDTLHVNGELTQGENIADLGGLTMAYYAYKKSLNGKKSPLIAGFTGEQRFFISWAQGWKSLIRDASLKQMIATNPHSPGNFRAVGPLSNMPEFYEAFDVKEGDGMYIPIAKRVNIW
ncbi:MAG: M13 family metallopeptidase [Bacteroidota bacterium]|jgi:putative endopeptidase